MERFFLNAKLSAADRGGRHRSPCSNWCRPLYGAQSRVNMRLSGMTTVGWGKGSGVNQ